MRRVAVIAFTLVLLPLSGTTPALAQLANAGAGKNELTNVRTAPDQTAEVPADPSRLVYPRLFCTPDGNSHFDSVAAELPSIDFAPPASPIHIGGQVPASTVFFGGFEAGWGAKDLKERLYHPAPAAQFIVVLQGDFWITTTDGETKHFGPGEVFRLEDTPPCKGHITVVGEKPGFFLFAR